MTEQINCPFCGNLIDRNAIKCKNCDALFNLYKGEVLYLLLKYIGVKDEESVY